MALLPEELTYTQWNLVYNALSLGIGCMMAATAFFWLHIPQVAKKYRVALSITGLVTFIAFYNYVRIFNSWAAAFTVSAGKDGYEASATGTPFNEGYRYMDWVMTVPLLLIELILVMDLPEADTKKWNASLGSAAFLMIVLGYPGEISDVPSTRWQWWTASMIPFCFVVFSLLVGLQGAHAKQPDGVKGLLMQARLLTVVSWCFYPLVYASKSMGLSGGTALVMVQVGYSIADIVAKALFGVLIWAMAMKKSALVEQGLLSSA